MKVQARHSCKACEGQGKLRVLHEENSEGGYWSIVRCGHCGGSGIVVVTTYRTDDSV